MEVRSLQTPNGSVARLNEPWTDAPRSSKSNDRLRRVVWVVLALYLAPVFLLVLLVGGLAMGILTLVRVCDRIIQGSSDPGQGLGMFSPLQPHIGITSGWVPRVGR
ncbi:hypothetical protein BH23PLA1_BH23PLA1_25440 [soil metagenome]